ncbi:MAG: GAF domain-containing sensor histidine kinase [Cyclobacteriaceae bacterium]|nr:GAF domain-containing sensor histidine kinase [Cyclobacteriaceae bacterium]
MIEIPENDEERVEALRAYQLTGTPPERDFDDLVEMASRICNMPMSAITLIDSTHQWLKAKVGLQHSVGPREEAFCAHTILDDRMLIVTDATLDKRFSNNPLVTGNPDIRFYAGMPLINPDGFRFGSLCVLDTKPRELTEDQRYYLSVLAKQVVKHMELRKKVLELQRLNDANSKLISVISHDLRSPLNSLFGLLHLVENHNLSQAEFKEFLPDVKRGFTAASSLLNNLLEWAALQFAQTLLKFSKAPLYPLVEDIINDNRHQFEKKNNVVYNKIETATQGWFNENLVKAILRNLLLNANKFTNKGVITVSARVDNDVIEIGVHDTGAGISPERVARLFEWESRTSTIGTGGEKGSGFGLQLCKEFAEQGSGSIWVSSQEGKGSVFYFTVPANRKG